MLTTLLDGIDSTDHNIYIAERPSVPTPKRKVEYVDVEGRHGSLTKLGPYEDTELQIEYNMLENCNIKPLIRQIKGYFLNKEELVFSDDYQYYYKIKNIQMDDIENEIEEYGKFTVNFRLDPFQYLKTDSITINKKTTIINPGTVESEPLIKVNGAGSGDVFINDTEINITHIDDYLEIDCDLKEAFRDGVSRNDKMKGNFPSLRVGKNEIDFIGAIESLTIEPRWRFI